MAMNKNRTFSALLLCTVILASCGRSPSDPTAVTANVDDYIDAQIQGEERAGIRAHMLKLPVSDWDAITYIDFENKKIYTNRVALQGLLSFAEKVPGAANLYTTKLGRRFALPNDDALAEGVRPLAQGPGTCTSTTGPFRRVRTAAGTSSRAYGYGAATVTLGSYPVKTAGGTPYAYMGATTPTSPPVESDVGLQYNTVSGDWGAYIRSNGRTVTSEAGAPERRYDPTTGTNFEYLVAADGIGRLRINKASTSPNVPNPLPIDFSQPGLRKDGVGNIVKRVTSIASPTSATGAYYSVQWLDMRVGLTTATNHAWGTYTSDTSTDNCSTSQVTYSNVTGGEKVIVQF
jgi:hypothetical protein